MARSKLKSDKIFEDWMARNNERIGEIMIPQVGEYPPTLENFYGSVVNEWVTTDVWHEIKDEIEKALDSYTLEDLVERQRAKSDVVSYVI